MAYIGDSAWLYGANETYISEMMNRWRDNPLSVDEEWAQVFESLDRNDTATIVAGLENNNSEAFRPSWGERPSKVLGGERVYMSDVLSQASEDQRNTTLKEILYHLNKQQGPRPSADQIRQATLDSVRAIMLIRAYRMRGHSIANLDPLQLTKAKEPAELKPETYGFTEQDWDRPIFLNYYLGLEQGTLREILAICRQTYCQNIGVEYMHIQDVAEKNWIQEQIETSRNRKDFTELGRRTILERITLADSFEIFLDNRFRGTKRFGLDGGESLIPLIEQIIKRGAQIGLEEIVIGMAHRGRLNVLANIMGKPYHEIFSEFHGVLSGIDDPNYAGDVKYHIGSSADREFDGKTVHLSLCPNPSHLEAVNTVVLGKVRAKQDQRSDKDQQKVMGLLLHGDAAFIGQGIVAETFLLSQLDGYRTGGTIHICTNNQIGFTTNPSKSRSSEYPTDMAKTIDAPVFHVNGDDPEACVHVARLSMNYRQKFGKDVVIDIICYRRHGHNEGDEPMFTQPLMYKKIKAHPRTREVYARQLVEAGHIEPNLPEQILATVTAKLEEEYAIATNYKPNKADWLEGKWQGLETAGETERRRGETGVSIDLIKEVGKAISKIPANFDLHSKIVRQLEDKQKMFETGVGIDWGTAEALAFGTLLCESTAVRLSGEDCERGTFSQRHSVMLDQNTEQRWVPLNHIRMGQARFEVIDSPLSEFGLLGFEYGYASAEPHALVVWEAQFGDFANGAQVIIDQFISSGESKWLRMCGLVMMLPHGFEGQGPEHSSARLERYLQLSGADNWQVCNCTTPANYFHVLRRQMRRNFRKPLVLMTPKSLLRHKLCVSEIEDFIEGTSFHRVLIDHADIHKELAADDKIKRVVLCSGKVYFDMREERDKRGIKDIFLLRLEQLYPFPEKSLRSQLERFPNAEVIWCQEEPQNMGAWWYIATPIESLLDGLRHKPNRRPRYVGRPAAASPSTGSAKRHALEQAKLVDEALTMGKS